MYVAISSLSVWCIIVKCVNGQCSYMLTGYEVMLIEDKAQVVMSLTVSNTIHCHKNWKEYITSAQLES